jgi:uncharacterized membrane protein YedE/YeeE
MTSAIITGLIVGIIFGFIMQRGRFCMNSAIRDTALLQDFTLLKSVSIAVLVMMFGFAIMSVAGWITPAPKPFFGWANFVGSFIFGIGMVLAGGCASGITYRVGEGMMGALAAVIGLAITGTWTATSGSILNQIAGKLKPAEPTSPTLASILNMEYWLLALIISIVAGVIWFLLARKNGDDDLVSDSATSLGDRIFKKSWNWLVTGIGIGIVGIISFPIAATAVTGRNYPLSITDGWIQWVKVVILNIEGQVVNWIAAMVLGIVVGAFIAALIAGEFKFRFPKPLMIGQAFLGGLIMGYGAVTSGGCNVTHILSGIPQLSLGSFLAAISIALGAWATAYLLFVRPNK